MRLAIPGTVCSLRQFALKVLAPGEVAADKVYKGEIGAIVKPPTMQTYVSPRASANNERGAHSSPSLRPSPATLALALTP